jgi:hypothetical protein
MHRLPQRFSALAQLLPVVVRPPRCGYVDAVTLCYNGFEINAILLSPSSSECISGPANLDVRSATR